MFDVIIVGAGPAGLSAALILGRCRRNVLVCDTGQYRNAASHALHGFLTRDGSNPTEFLQLGRDQLQPYESIELRHMEVTDVAHTGTHFYLTLADGTHATCRKLLLATGIVDTLPSIEGMETYYGRGVYHCPYCDAWEVRDQPLIVYGAYKQAQELALELTVWSHNLVLCTNGPSQLDERARQRLSDNGIQLCEERIKRLEGTDGHLEQVALEHGTTLPCKALFFRTDEQQRSNFAAKLGSDFTDKGAVRTDDYERTNVPGLYVAGDASRRPQLVIVAAAEGAEAAFAINTALLKEDLL